MTAAKWQKKHVEIQIENGSFTLNFLALKLVFLIPSLLSQDSACETLKRRQQDSLLTAVDFSDTFQFSCSIHHNSLLLKQERVFQKF